MGNKLDEIRRFIPTGVGNMARGCKLSVRGSVYPHGRGEHTNYNPLLDKRKTAA